jgi:hypothetical protein
VARNQGWQEMLFSIVDNSGRPFEEEKIQEMERQNGRGRREKEKVREKGNKVTKAS